MKAASWRKKLKQACEDAGTYRPYFDSVISTLADILEARDAAQKWYEDSGAKPVIYYTNKAGNKNLTQHPALTTISSMNKEALSYFRDLGLTPAGLKKVTGKVMTEEQKSKFSEIFSVLE